jgi:hypothetical protein
MKHKVAELEGGALEEAVSKAEGWHRYWSLTWDICGPIIERERIAVLMLTGEWRAWAPNQTTHVREYDPKYWLFEQTDTDADASGPTPLIAAMRAYVASKFGDEIELP